MITTTIVYVDFDHVRESCPSPRSIDQVHADGRLIMAASAGRLGHHPPAGRQNFFHSIRSVVVDDVPHDLYEPATGTVARFARDTLTRLSVSCGLRIRRIGDHITTGLTEPYAVTAQTTLIRRIVVLTVEPGACLDFHTVARLQGIPGVGFGRRPQRIILIRMTHATLFHANEQVRRFERRDRRRAKRFVLNGSIFRCRYRQE